MLAMDVISSSIRAESMVDAWAGLPSSQEAMGVSAFRVESTEACRQLLTIIKTVMDAGYTSLVNLLQRKTSGIESVPSHTIHGAFAHYLSVLPIPHLPALLRSIITSPSLWQTRKWTNLSEAQGAVRQAVSLKLRVLNKTTPAGLIFSADIATPFSAWAVSALDTLRDIPKWDVDQALVKVTILGGLLQGLEDIRLELDQPRVRAAIQDALVLACQDALQLAIVTRNSWGSEMDAEEAGKPDVVAITICLFSHVLPLVPTDKLRGLDLQTVFSCTLDLFTSTFHGGKLINGLNHQVSKDSDGKWAIQPNSEIAQCTSTLLENIAYKSIAPISKLLTRSLTVLADSYKSSQRQQVWPALGQLMDRLDMICNTIEQDWAATPLASVSNENEIAVATHPITLRLWQIFKTLLFSTVLVSQAVVTVITFNEPSSTGRSGADMPPATPFSAPALASSVLQILSKLAFISSKFGGLTADGGGFGEQKRLFFSALDIVGSNGPASEELLRILSQVEYSSLEYSHTLRQSKSAFFLACGEQLVPAISEHTTEFVLLPFAKKFLSGPTHRETFESAHSVLLAIFVAEAKRAESHSSDEEKSERLAVRLAPFYLTSLLENSIEGRLSAEQFRLAYQTLVRSVNACDAASTWYCINALITALDSAKKAAVRPTVRRLRTTLASLVSTVGLPLLPNLTSAISTEIVAAEKDDKVAMCFVLQREVLSAAGDAQKEYALNWWLDMRVTLANQAQAR